MAGGLNLLPPTKTCKNHLAWSASIAPGCHSHPSSQLREHFRRQYARKINCTFPKVYGSRPGPLRQPSAIGYSKAVAVADSRGRPADSLFFRLLKARASSNLRRFTTNATCASGTVSASGTSVVCRALWGCLIAYKPLGKHPGVALTPRHKMRSILHFRLRDSPAKLLPIPGISYPHRKSATLSRRDQDHTIRKNRHD